MAKQVWKPATLLSPLPAALVTCGTVEEPNVLTIAWTGIINTQPPKTYISVRPSRHSYELIKSSGKFVINLAYSKNAAIVDYCGVRSGKDTNKFADTGLEICSGLELTDTPVLVDSPLSLECVVTDVISLGTHDMFIADIVAVNIDERYIDEKGKFHPEKCAFAAYAHGQYFALGKKIGSFGYSVKKKNKRK